MPAGTWQAEVWIWDNDFQATGEMFVGHRVNSAETIHGSFAMNPTDPAARFTFESDGIARYDIFVRENNDTSNRSRINAVRLSMIPEPGSAALALAAGIAALTRRRRRSQGQKQRCLD